MSAALAVVVIRAITVSVVTVPVAFKPLNASSVISLTVLGVLAATAACFLLNRASGHPVNTFRRVAPAALLLSFVPDIAIWASHGYAHTASASTVLPLMIMHVAVGTLCIVLLPLLGAATGVQPIAAPSQPQPRPATTGP